MIKHYFGTSLTDKGHYIWEISEDGKRLKRSSLSFVNLPFSPEFLTQNLNKGEINWLYSKSRFGIFTVCAITGSPTDVRLGCKSVFWVKEDLMVPFEQMKRRIMETPICVEIINKMPFPIFW